MGKWLSESVRQKASTSRSPFSNKQVWWEGVENGGTGETVTAAYLNDIKGNSTGWKNGQGLGNRRQKRGQVSEKTNFFHVGFPQAWSWKSCWPCCGLCYFPIRLLNCHLRKGHRHSPGWSQQGIWLHFSWDPREENAEKHSRMRTTSSGGFGANAERALMNTFVATWREAFSKKLSSEI